MAAGAGAGLELVAPAKLNLALEVLGPRGDGYHEIDTVLTTIDLCDRVRLRPRPRGAGLKVAVSGPHASGIDSGSELAGAAARALAEASGRQPDLHIEVEKRIPASGRARRRLLRRRGRAARPRRAVGARLGRGAPGRARGLARIGRAVLPRRRRRAGGGARGADRAAPRPQAALDAGAGPAGAGGSRQDRPPLRRSHPRATTPAASARGASRTASPAARRPPPATWSTPSRPRSSAPSPSSSRTTPPTARRGAPTLHLCGAGPAAYVLVHERAKRAELAEAFRARGALVIPARTLGRDAARAARELPPPGAAGGG